MSNDTDILASVVLGVAGFFLPGIFKSAIARRKGMTMCAKEIRDTFIFDSALDPLSMQRWFWKPESMRKADQEDSKSKVPTSKSSKTPQLIRTLWLPLTLALLTQAALVLLQLATTRKLVGSQGVTGQGVTFVPPSSGATATSLKPRVSRCKPTQTKTESLSSITTCYDTFFLNYGVAALRNDQYDIRLVRTFAKSFEQDVVLFTVQVISEVFIRQVQITPRIMSRFGMEAYVSVNEGSVTATNEALWRIAESILFADDMACSRPQDALVQKLTEYQTIWTKRYNCFGPPYALGNNPETSSKFNTFAGVLANSFQVEGTSTYYADTMDAAIAVDSLETIEMEWVTSSERVLSDGTIFGILGAVIALKLLADFVFGEDVLYKATFLAAEVAGQSSCCASFLDLKGRLEYHGCGVVHEGDVYGGFCSLQQHQDEQSDASNCTPPMRINKMNDTRSLDFDVSESSEDDTGKNRKELDIRDECPEHGVNKDEIDDVRSSQGSEGDEAGNKDLEHLNIGQWNVMALSAQHRRSLDRH